jgi:hypothetical protein
VIRFARLGEFAALHLVQNVPQVRALNRCLAGQHFVEQGPEAVDVGGRRQFGDPLGLFGAHVRRRADDAVEEFRVAVARAGFQRLLTAGPRPIVTFDRASQTPIDDQCLAVLADHHVVGLDVAV